ncbi:tRNA (adenosine(37)-N6)-threonylcarbamoyltransferase complex dimerization subunit type 1 TsaB [Rhabdochromatium marinum]|uniref:tRNA (adenosine(37)-N6)-threonylcarbamoyltransferase complex dimerization subunit type 1 TsaB n=1 Tax=Rhabdochromatium marinum TaxID=48729 RepID=UPI001908CFE0|nr:tRNA (adenosine(37)-N6)-threonylcarbamoyltransferase complex dimerization subunit type 1 TsaB [Rhabdochromatium marinum]MBK1650177.1 tRNA (adenosine(37)-N6)-threonylcarbamoyltransferase complex dimerization subunit type 1 TsaB [Rhabdochromatium marinum]
MKILALETSGIFCSAALWRDGELFTQHEEAARQHGERLLPMLDRVLAQGELELTQLDAIAFGRGPGSFTGVRIAAAVAQGIAFGAGVPLVGISTLAALAQAGWRCHGHSRILAAIDARISEVYWGLYQVEGPGQVRTLQAEQVSAPEAIHSGAAPQGFDPPQAADFGVGNAWELYRDILSEHSGLDDARIDAQQVCTAAEIAELAVTALAAGEAVAPEHGLPVYVRDQVAHKRLTSHP